MKIRQTHMMPPARLCESDARKLALLLLCCCAFSLALAGCRNDNNNSAQNQNQAPQASPSTAAAEAFDGQRAFEHVRKQVEIGPRPAGSAELGKARDYIVGELHSYGLNITLDTFDAQTPVGTRKMVNITAELQGESSDVIIISSHYDTKLFRDFTFVGANDGGSSTGALLELARVLGTQANSAQGKKPKFTYWFVFFDGEEAFCNEWDECKNKDGSQDNTYGSRRYVETLKDQNQLKRVRAMILLDMMGYTSLEMGRDRELSTPWLMDIIWGTALELGHKKQFVDRDEGVGGDDHEPFVRAGIPSVDLIQLGTYCCWHQPNDTLDKISPASLKIVGDVVLASLPRIEQRLASGK